MTGPPNGKAGPYEAGNPAADVESERKLARQLQAVNGVAPAAWIREGFRLLREYKRTGKLKHLLALHYHVDGIAARIREEAP